MVKKIIFGALIIIVIVVVAFTLGDFGLDTNVVMAGYASSRRYASDAHTVQVSYENFAQLVQIESEFQDEVIETNEDNNGQLYKFPYQPYNKPDNIIISLELFSYDNSYYYGNNKPHMGLDLFTASAGSDVDSIVAPCDGHIKSVSDASNYNIIILEEYDKTGTDVVREWLFYHGIPSVSAGQNVKAGDKLGTVSNVGAKGAHLHTFCRKPGTTNNTDNYTIWAAGMFDMGGNNIILSHTAVTSEDKPYRLSNMAMKSDLQDKCYPSYMYLNNLSNGNKYIFRHDYWNGPVYFSADCVGRNKWSYVVDATKPQWACIYDSKNITTTDDGKPIYGPLIPPNPQ